MKRGLYLVLEGGDATGKSHQAAALAEWLRSRGETVLHLREPGSTATGEALRKLLLDRETGELAPLSEALLFSAARAEMIRREVAPSLAAGNVVLAERCYLSTYVYQGGAARAHVAGAGDPVDPEGAAHPVDPVDPEGAAHPVGPVDPVDPVEPAPLDLLRAVTAAAHDSCWPDRIFLLDVDDETRRARADGAGKADRFEAREESFHAAVRRAYLELGALDPKVEVVDAAPPATAVQAELRARILRLLEPEVKP